MEKPNLKTITIIIVSIIFIAILAFCGYKLIKYNNYKKTYEYRLTKIGYSKDEFNTINKKLNENQLNKLLSYDYNQNISKLVKEKYFIYNNLDEYIKYIKNNKDINISKIISIVNTKSNYNWYKNIKETDVSKNELMLVNKHNYLKEDYIPSDLKTFNNLYAYGNRQQLRKIAYDAYIEMFNAAKKENFTLIVNSSYRSFKDQEQIYNDYSTWYGENEALKKAAKPGYSEHQTGLAVDIQSYCSQKKEFDECDEFKWLENNAYKYGFVLRFPKEKEDITGYTYESWHYRYVGIKVATYIHENDITFDEYYAFYENT